MEKDSPEGKIFSSLWSAHLSSSKLALDHGKWTLTGISAVVTVLIANSDKITGIISTGFLKIGMIFLVFSMIAGFLSLLLLLAIQTSKETKETGDKLLQSDDFKNGVDAIVGKGIDFCEVYSEPYFEPLKSIVKWAFKKGESDQLYAEKWGVKLVSMSFIIIMSHYLLAGIGLLFLICGII